MNKNTDDQIVSLEIDQPIWDHFFLVSSLVLVGSRDANGEFNLAPKHMAFPLGWKNYFGFVCTPRHSTYKNIKREKIFTVTYPRPTQVLFTTLAAAPRVDDDVKPSLLALPTFPAKQISGRFVSDSYLYLECSLDRIIDEFGDNSLIAAKIIAAHVNQDALRTSVKDDDDLIRDAPLLAYLEPGRFATIRESLAFPFPTDFKR
jgi:flavin reductase (DIM6/NTAB) family NADH-FMN oxidoreductase RutF